MKLINSIKVSIGILIISLITSCLPMYKTNYIYQPPQTEFGIICVNDCLFHRTHCNNQCNSQALNCKALNNVTRSTESAIRYSDYLILNQQDNNYPRTNNSNNIQCDINKNSCLAYCEETYKACYTNCGGNIIEQPVCIAGCKPH